MDGLYHYCSTSAFHGIGQTHSIWLSSLSLSNDSMEGKLVANVITRLADRDGLMRSAIERLQKSIGFLENAFDGLGFCLSEERDLLSQWRGYAADATGVAIGFSHEYLEWLAESSRGKETPGFSLLKVEYDSKGHQEQVEPTYRQIRKLIDAGAFKTRGLRTLFDTRTDEEVAEERKEIQRVHGELFIALMELFPKLFLLKSSAFREECEWRLVSYFIRGGKDTCSYRAMDDRLIQYRQYQLLQTDRSPIVEVVLGPKHLTPIPVVADFLRQSGFGEVKVTRSEATYR